MATSKDVHGWTAVPLNADVVLNDEIRSSGSPRAITVKEIEIPHSSLAKKVITYAENELNEQTFNHSMRVYFYGQLSHVSWVSPCEALRNTFAAFLKLGKSLTVLDPGRAIQTIYFPTWELSSETYLLTCLLHDIGTTEKNLNATRMSFEFYGGYLAMNVLKDMASATPIEQAEAVAEAVIRHQDIGTSGKITSLGQLIQLATILGMYFDGPYTDWVIAQIVKGRRLIESDNTGVRANFLHQTTTEDVIKHYPRTGWSSCFAGVIRKENSLKPWAHTTVLGEEEFPRNVMDNEIGKRWD